MRLALALATLVLALCGAPAALAVSDAEDGARADVRRTTELLLLKFYDARPRLRPEVQGAAGYAVFTTYGSNLMGIGGNTGRGVGIALDPRTSNEVFMGMRQTNPDPNANLECEILFVFSSAKAFESFALRGWKAGGSEALPADAKVYTYAKKSVEAATSLPGASFWKDGALN